MFFSQFLKHVFNPQYLKSYLIRDYKKIRKCLCIFEHYRQKDGLYFFKLLLHVSQLLSCLAFTMIKYRIPRMCIEFKDI